jgi:putative transposase
MARLPRYYINNQPQHILLQSMGDAEVFHDPDDYDYYRDCLAYAAENNDLKIHAYAIMPTQVSILASPGNDNSIPRTLQSVGRNYVQYYNYYYEHKGTLWEGRYRATVVDPKNYLLLCSQYIESKPVRAGTVKNPKDYKWSSYSHNGLGKNSEIISDHKTYASLGKTAKDRATAYRATMKKKLDAETLDYIRDTTKKGWAMGDAKFAAKIEKICGRRATPLPKGRPKGS